MNGVIITDAIINILIMFSIIHEKGVIIKLV